MIKRGVLMFTALISCIILLSTTVSASSEPSYDISDETVEIIKERVVETISEGGNKVELDDLGIIVRLSSQEFYPEYKEFLELVADINAEYGLIRYGDYYEQYFFCSPTVEPLPSADMYGNGDNIIRDIYIFYDDYYLINGGEKCDTELVERDKQLASETFNNIISCVDDSMSDIEKALRIHDYLILLNNFPDATGIDDYGYEYYDAKAHKGLSLLTDRNGVCMSYARIYACALNAVGIRAITVDSSEMLHEWNMIEIDGEWYHVDVTWDDPRYPYGTTLHSDYNADNWDIGSIIYDYFLLSDEEMLNNSHYGWIVSRTFNQDYVPYNTLGPASGSSGAFSDYFFKLDGSYLPITNYAYCDGYWYFYDALTPALMRVKCEAGAEPEIVDCKNLFSENYATYISEYGGSIYISTRSEIFRYDPKENKIGKILLAEENVIFTEMSIIEGEMTLVKLDYSNTANDVPETNTEYYSMALIENTGDFEIPPETTTTAATTTEPPETTTAVTTVTTTSTSSTTAENNSIFNDLSSNLIVYAISAGLIIIAVVIIFVAVMKKRKEKNL